MNDGGILAAVRLFDPELSVDAYKIARQQNTSDQSALPALCAHLAISAYVHAISILTQGGDKQADDAKNTVPSTKLRVRDVAISLHAIIISGTNNTNGVSVFP